MIFLGLSINSAYAASSSNIPADLMYENKPINPLCFEQVDSTDKTVSLSNNCGLEPIVEVDQSKDLINKGYVGFDYKEKDSSDSATSYSYYKVIGDFNHYYTIFSISNTGGSGNFSSIYLVKRDNNQLHIKPLPYGGDRCNGGLNKVTQNKQMLSFDSNITPGDFLSISNKNPHKLQAYDDLDACAACCIATALYETNLQKDSAKATLISIQFSNDQETLDQLKSADSKGYQACFNMLVLKYIAEAKTTLTAKELDSFMDEFNSNCVKAN